MAKSKKKILTPEALKLIASRFKLLADPMRLTILNQLEEGELSVNAIAESVEASQPNVSKHLKILQEAGLPMKVFSSFAKSSAAAYGYTYPRRQVFLARH
jgi:predicted transcriptional regulator